MAKEEIEIPDAPAFLPEAMSKKWRESYAAALKQAAIDTPDNPGAQRAAATKAANRLLVVPAPESAKEIDGLANWQILHRSTRTKDGVETRHCVTIDGRKYAHPVAKQKGNGNTKDGQEGGAPPAPSTVAPAA